MKILLTGGGTAGHFYPLIAIAEALYTIAEEEKLVRPKLYYMSTSPYDKKVLFDNDIKFKIIFSGKQRLYFSLLNILDAVKIAVGVVKALWSTYLIYPDVIVSKGGYASVPVVVAARIFRIPLIIHESDSVPGRSNVWAAKYATRIALSWREATSYFDEKKVAVTGQPIRKEVLHPITHGAHEYLKLDSSVPTILVLGGSQGAQKINNVILDALPLLLPKYQIIHQVGEKNVEEVKQIAEVVLKDNPKKKQYYPFGFLNVLALRMAVGASSLIISRAGSTIFEIASWGVPSILIPIADSNGDHQRKNAFNYSRTGSAIVVEEQNLSAHLIAAEITRLIENEGLRKTMGETAKKFYKENGAITIAKEAIRIALGHER